MPFPPSGPEMILTLEGGAHRSNYGEGRYGRAADLHGGGDAIKATNLYANYLTHDLHAWWKLRSAASGTLWREKCRFYVGLSQGTLYVAVYAGDCVGLSVTTSSLSWPLDGDWHHLHIHRFNDGIGTPEKFALRIDFGRSGEEIVSAASLPAVEPMTVHFGLGVDGLVDELQAANFAGAEALFDYDPEHCGLNPASSTVCEEVTVRVPSTDLTQPEITWDLPVRYKLIYDSQACSGETPCKVVFAWSGGGACAGNYIRASDEYVEKLVARGLAVVTADPICWTFTWTAYPDEVIQFLAVKDDVASNSFLDLSEYYATGCSNGAIKVLKWAVLDDHGTDHPKRTFARSAGGMLGDHPDCEYHEVWCGEKQAIFDAGTFGPDGDQCLPGGIEPPWPHPHDDPDALCVDEYWESRTPFIQKITEELVVTEGREIGRSWGVNVLSPQDPDPPCDADTTPTAILCSEQGGLGATDGGRWFRDKWKEVEAAHLPEQDWTGYFIENDTADCQHCALRDGFPGDQLDCAADYVAFGRGSLSQDCLDWDSVPPGSVIDCSTYPK